MLKKITQNVGIIILLIISLSASNYASNSNSKKIMSKAKKISKEAYLKFDKVLFLKSNGLLERILSAEPSNAEARYYLAYNQYRLLVIAMEKKEKDLSGLYYKSAIENAKKVSRVKKYKSDGDVLLAAIYMMKLSSDKSEAPVISAKIYSLLKEAQLSDSTNPRVYLIRGIMRIYTPPMFGGSIDSAIKNFDMAISLFNKNTRKTIDWGYVETLAWKGQALIRKNKYRLAKKTYDQALEVEPEFGWVRYNLLPQLEKTMIKPEQKIDTKTGNIKVIITDLNNNKGEMMIALNNSKENFEHGQKPFVGVTEKIKNRQVVYTFNNVPFGEYAIKCYYDENRNKKLDKNFFGMPTEQYGFSNNARGSFGPPKYDDAKFTLNKKNLIIKIRVD